MKVRRASLELVYQNVDISKDIESDLTSFTYTDNAHGVADDVSISLKDNNLKWLNDWFPEKGDKVMPVIKTENWRKDKDSQSLDCGSFVIDEPGCSGPPSVITINGNSMPSNSGFKDEKKTRSWASQSLKMIAERIASDAGLELLFDSEYNPRFKYQLQEKTSDAGFLKAICDDHDFGMKISSDMLILYSMEEYCNKESVFDFVRGGKGIKSYTCSTTLAGTSYNGVKIRYKDSSGKVKWYKYIPEPADKQKILSMETIAEDYAAAEKMTLLRYRNISRKEYVINLSLTLNLEIVGAVCITISGFGKFDGKYFVDKVTHSIGGGSTTSIEARRISET